MKHAQLYKNAVAWVAETDEPTIKDAETISGFISTQLVADLFNVHPNTVAGAIARLRNQKSG